MFDDLLLPALFLLAMIVSGWVLGIAGFLQARQARAELREVQAVLRRLAAQPQPQPVPAAEAPAAPVPTAAPPVAAPPTVAPLPDLLPEPAEKPRLRANIERDRRLAF